ncbi:MAG TPA: BatA domain-containing protein [Gemmatimonadales bacterium]
MGFLQPLALLGLAAAGIPALLHLLQRRTPPTVPFPAVRYLAETERRHSRRLKLRNLLLLLLRMALLACIAVAAARPVARLPFGDLHGPSALAVVVDNSLSSAAVQGGRRVLDALTDRARGVFGRTASGDHLWLVLADGIPRRVTRIEALLALDSLRPAGVRLDVADAVRAAARVVADDPLPGEVVVVSDLQRGAVSSGPLPPARTLVAGVPAPPENRGIAAVRITPDVWSAGGTVVSTLDGTGTDDRPVRLEIGGVVVARTLAAPGRDAVMSVEGVAPGWHAARVLLDPDELRGDDVWHVAVRGAPPTATSVARGAGPFVQQAIGVLQEAGRLSHGTEVRLGDRVEIGRTILFPPDEPVELGGVNRALAARGIPWRFGDPLTGEWTLQGDLRGLEDARVLRRYHLTGEGQVVATAGGEPWIVRQGALVIVASRLEPRWTTLPVTAGFVPFLDALINRVAAAEAWRVEAAAGATVVLPSSAAALLGPQGRLPLATAGAVQAPTEPGVYFLLGNAGDTVGALQVNHDRREIPLEPAAPREIRTVFGPDAGPYAAGALDRELFRGARRADLAGWFLALALLFAAVELGLASAGGRVRED